MLKNNVCKVLQKSGFQVGYQKLLFSLRQLLRKGPDTFFNEYGNHYYITNAPVFVESTVFQYQYFIPNLVFKMCRY
jgi:hypothetical protein